MFAVDTRTTLTLARLHQEDVKAAFPRNRRKDRPERSLPPAQPSLLALDHTATHLPTSGTVSST